MATLHGYRCGDLVVRYAGFQPQSREFMLDVGFLDRGDPIFNFRKLEYIGKPPPEPDPEPGFVRIHEKHDARFLDALQQVMAPPGAVRWSPRYPDFTCDMRVLPRSHGQDRVGSGSIFPQAGPPYPYAYAQEIADRTLRRVKHGGPLDDDYIEMVFVFAASHWVQGPAFITRQLRSEVANFIKELRDEWKAQWHHPDVQKVFNPPPPRRRPTWSFAETVVINDAVAIGPDRFDGVGGTAWLESAALDPLDDRQFSWQLPAKSLSTQPAMMGEPHLFTREGRGERDMRWRGLQAVMLRPHGASEFTLSHCHPRNFKKVGHLVLIDRIEITSDRTQAMLVGRIVNSRAAEVDGPTISAYIDNWQYARHRVRKGGIFHVSLAILARQIRYVHERRWLNFRASSLPVEFCLKPTGDGPKPFVEPHQDPAWFSPGSARPDDVVFSGNLHDCYDSAAEYLGQTACHAMIEVSPIRPKGLEVGLTFTQAAITGNRAPRRGDWVEGVGWLTASVGEFEDYRFNIVDEEE